MSSEILAPVTVFANVKTLRWEEPEFQACTESSGSYSKRKRSTEGRKRCEDRGKQKGFVSWPNKTKPGQQPSEARSDPNPSQRNAQGQHLDFRQSAPTIQREPASITEKISLYNTERTSLHNTEKTSLHNTERISLHNTEWNSPGNTQRESASATVSPWAVLISYSSPRTLIHRDIPAPGIKDYPYRELRFHWSWQKIRLHPEL